ncbi:lipopolysaccharide biosynthesis protein [Rhodococcoides corynebacterioides]|uniref:lipopolysaccharide biosynthesis protein n=1 Tax=Rhodococcoides corynebacterioides TaxID=53972 RepID=UPI003F7FF312
MTTRHHHALRAGLASLWSYLGRAVGLLWTVALVHGLGVAAYGRYAVAVACASLINAGIDNAFHVRSLRLDEHRYEQERAARTIVGIGVGALGVVCFTEWFVVGFALVMASGEMLFNTAKSRTLRGGRPDRTMRYDAARQVASIGCGGAGLYLWSTPTIETVGALYLMPYAVVAAICLGYLPRRRPARPGATGPAAALTLEAIAAAAYTQGDVVVIGWVAGDTVAGYYSLAFVAALAISSIGQNYANTFVERMRNSGGHHSEAPSLRDSARVGLVTGAGMLIVGLGILVWGGADYTGVVAVVLSVFVAARAVDHTFVLLLIVRGHDRSRIRITVVSAVLKIALLTAVVTHFGGYGAAVTTALCEVGVAFALYRAAHGCVAPAPGADSIDSLGAPR